MMTAKLVVSVYFVTFLEAFFGMAVTKTATRGPGNYSATNEWPAARLKLLICFHLICTEIASKG